jgi:hypothetical protein
VSLVGLTLLVGTLLFAINHLDVVLADETTPRVVAKALLTYVVPLCVSNYGLLVGRRVRVGASAPGP